MGFRQEKLICMVEISGKRDKHEKDTDLLNEYETVEKSRDKNGNFVLNACRILFGVLRKKLVKRR